MSKASKRAARQPITIRTTAEKLVFGGQALAHYEGKAVFLWNALPGEEVDALITRRNKNHWEGVATEIITPSLQRIQPIEPHYLSSSPWGILSLENELQYKREIALETYARIGKVSFPFDLEIDSDDQTYGYRNKIEFSFYEYNEDHSQFKEGMQLAFFQRGQKYKLPIASSELAEPVINSTAKKILDWIRQQPLTRRELKTLIIRSNGKGQAIAALFIKDHLQFENYPELSDELVGFHVYYSYYKSPASTPDELLYSTGQNYLEHTIADVKLRYGLLGFFQVNVPMFERALLAIKPWVPAQAQLLDFYSGVGAIGLPLATGCESVEFIDNNQEAIEYAQENIQNNALTQCRAQCIPAENITELINGYQTVIVDPPRAGLHVDVTNRLLEVTPKTIIYLSCNISTQARDIQLLSEKYTVEFAKLYNFFPRTPHIEGLCILTLQT